MNTIFDHHMFEETLAPGTIVEARWSAGSGGHYRGTASVVRVNKSSIRVALVRPVPENPKPGTSVYPIGHELTICRALANGGRNAWSWQINSVHPIATKS